MHTHDVLIIGAGPAGVTAAYELAHHQGRGVLLVEAEHQVGGLSRTVEHQGYRIDIGGHRFFSKSDWVMQWWRNILPIAAESTQHIHYHGKDKAIETDGADAMQEDVMLIRRRLSRIYFDRKFFDYPLKPNLATARRLGPARCMRFLGSYMHAHARPIHPEQSLEDFFINRFGRALYETFFRDYTEKVWGIRCNQISAEWGAQRVKSLSIGKALAHALTRPLRRDGATATSLIEQFLYPKYGPGQMWERACKQARRRGVEFISAWKADGIELRNNAIDAVLLRQVQTGATITVRPRHVISTMPVRDLVLAMGDKVPGGIRDIAVGLQYRDFLTIGLRYRKLLRDEGARQDGGACTIPDNWIYVQEPGVQVGRLQFFNNWSPWMVADLSRVWVGMEYFCNETDSLWKMSDDALKRLGAQEMEALGLAAQDDCEDGIVVRAAKAYPGYYGCYSAFPAIRSYLDGIENLFLVGRNGMHRYNNQDHSMLTAKLAVEAIVTGTRSKSAIWNVNIDDEYHEEKRY